MRESSKKFIICRETKCNSSTFKRREFCAKPSFEIRHGRFCYPRVDTHRECASGERGAGRESANILRLKKAGNLPSNVVDKIDKDGYGKPRLAVSPDKGRRAFVLCVGSGTKEVPSCVTRVFVMDVATDVIYEISGEQLFIESNRPVDNLKWINNNILSYERWTGPRFGRRYVVDVKQMKQTGAFILSDR